MPTPYAKLPLTVPDQIALLRGRGLEIKMWTGLKPP